MNYQTMMKAEQEALRFLDAVKTVKIAFVQPTAEQYTMLFMGCAESGALRRASMDLTRALATLRKP